MAFQQFSSYLNSLFWTLFGPIISHVKVLLGQFDPVLDVPRSINSAKLDHLAAYRRARKQSDERTKHNFFFFVWFYFVFNMVDNVYVAWLDDFDYYNRRMPELLYHKMYPEKFWPQSDLIMFSIALCSLVVYYKLWRGQWLDDRYCMYFVYDGPKVHRLIVNGRVWNKSNADKIYTFRQSNHRMRKIFMFISYFFFQPYFQYHLWSKEERGIRHTFMSGYLSIMLCYTVFAVLMLFYHFFIASKYVMIKQQFLIQRLNKLMESLRLPSKRTRTTFYALYTEFCHINRHLAYQCEEIRGYNRFWSIYLSAQFASNIFCIGYLAYCYIFIPATFDQKVYYIFFGAELALLVFAIIYRCSVIDANNDLCYDRNMKICVLFQLHFRVSPALMANIDTIATNRNFSRACFRLKNNYRLDSTAFNMALFIITTFFMSITKRAQRLRNRFGDDWAIYLEVLFTKIFKYL